MTRPIATWIADRVGPLARIDAIDLSLRLTLLDLLLRPIGSWSIRPWLLLLAAAGLVVPGWSRRPALWFALAGLTAARVALDWPLADNHSYLISYWCLAIAISSCARDTAACLATNGRLLVGLVFAFAVLWKLWLSPDFADGTFFRVTLLRDPRFAEFTQLATGISADELAGFREGVERHLDAPPFEVEPMPPLPWRFDAVARFATLWTLALEGALAIAFLWWRDGIAARARHALLIGFCASTYAVATVEGFGWLLVSMGVAQCAERLRKTQLLYVACFALILLYREVPWERLLLMAFA